MTETTYPTTNPILGIEDDLPERVHVLYDLSGKNACYCFFGVHCLVAFLTQLEAVKWACASGLGTLTVCSMEIDKALDLAKSKPDPCVALGIWGDGDIARMIYVK